MEVFYHYWGNNIPTANKAYLNQRLTTENYAKQTQKLQAQKSPREVGFFVSNRYEGRLNARNLTASAY